MKVSVLGAGAVGSMIGGLVRKFAPDVNVVLIGRGEHGRVLQQRQAIQLDGPWGTWDVPIRADTNSSAVAGSDVVLFTVKSQATKEAAHAARPHWGDATIVSIQNGINEHLLLPYVDASQLVMGVTATNIELVEPGRVSLQLGGATVLGPPARHPLTDRATGAAELLQRIQVSDLQFEAHANAPGMRYNKLAVNALGYSSCLSASNFISEALTYGPWRAGVGRPIVAECRRVFDAAGVRLEPIPGVPSLPKLERIMKVMDLPGIGAVVALGARRRFDRKPIVFSLLQDLRRGKPTEVEFVNGEVVRLATTLGMPAPANAEVVRMVRELESRGAGQFFTRDEVIARFRDARAGNRGTLAG